MRAQACALGLICVGAMLVGARPAASAGTSTGYCARPTDTVPPAITAVSLSTKTVNLSKGPQSLGVTVHADDTSAGTVSGVRQVVVDAYRRHQEKRIFLTLQSGTPEDGVWTGAFSFNRHDLSGTWVLRLFRIRDGAGNEIYYIRNVNSTPDQPYDPRLQPGWDGVFTVSGTPTTAFLHAGHPDMLTLSPGVIDTTHHSGLIHVVTQLTGPQPWRVQIVIGGFDFHTGHSLGDFFLTRRGASWSGAIPVPMWAGSGRRQVMVIARYRADVKWRDGFFYPDELKSHGLPTSVKIVSGRDTDKPTLASFDFTPTAVDSTTQSQVVNVTAEPTDPQSGVAAVYVRFAFGTTKIQPPTSHPVPLRRSSDALTDDVGTSNEPFVRLVPNGSTWSGSLTIPGCVHGGVWKAGVYVQDAAGRHRDYDDQALRNAGLPETLNVTSNAVDTYPPGVSAASVDASSQTITVGFDHPVFNVSPSNLTIYAQRNGVPDYSSSLPIGSITCSNASGNVACDGSAGGVTTAVLQVPSIVAATTYEVWVDLNQVVPQVVDSEGYAVSPEYGPQGFAAPAS